MPTLQEKLEDIIGQLESKVPVELNGDDGLQDANWNKTVASVKLLTEAVGLIKTTPSSLPYKGASYFRMPGMQKPWEALPFTLEDEWIKVHERYSGDFMRLAGGYASKFKEDSDSISYDSGVNGSGGGQRDTFEQHSHSYSQRSGYTLPMTAGGRANTRAYEVGASWGNYRTGGANGRTGGETRPKNFTIELYIYKGKDV